MPVILASTQNKNIGDDRKDERSVMNALLYNLIQLGQPDYKTNINCQFDNLNIGVNIANGFPNDFVISNHSNACNGNDSILRTEIYYHFTSIKGKELALKFQGILKKYFPNRTIQVLPDNRDYKSGFFELRETTAPAILIEWYYHDSLNDIMWYTSNYNMIIKAMCEFIGLVYPEPKPIPIEDPATAGINIAFNKKYITDKNYWNPNNLERKSKEEIVNSVRQLFKNISARG